MSAFYMPYTPPKPAFFYGTFKGLLGGSGLGGRGLGVGGRVLGVGGRVLGVVGRVGESLERK